MQTPGRHWVDPGGDFSRAIRPLNTWPTLPVVCCWVEPCWPWFCSKLIVGLEFLLPISLYLSIVVALGRLYADEEITALHACGVGVDRVLKAVLCVALVVAAVTASVSLYLRPWAYERFYLLRAQAMSEFDIARMEGGNFFEISQERSVIFAEKVDHGERERRYFYSKRPRGLAASYSGQGRLSAERRAGGPPVLEFKDGYVYEFSRQGEGDSVLKFERSTLSLPPRRHNPPDSSEGLPPPAACRIRCPQRCGRIPMAAFRASHSCAPGAPCCAFESNGPAPGQICESGRRYHYLCPVLQSLCSG